LGPYVIHIGLLVILGGALVGNVWGFQGFMTIEEGTSSDIVRLKMDRGFIQLPFQVHCDEFTLETYPGTEKPKKFESDLRIVQDGNEVARKHIVVNDPLEYGGMTIYQSSFGETDTPTITVRAERPDGSLITTFTTPVQEPTHIDGTGMFMAMRYMENFEGFGPGVLVAFKPEGTPMLPPDDDLPADPMEMFGLLEKAGLMTFPVLTQAIPMLEQEIVPQAGARFILEEVEPRYYPGLQVTKDPGVGTVWIGSAMVMMGLGMAMFWAHRRVWVRLDDESLTVVGNSNKHQVQFERDFGELVERLKGL